MFLIKKKSTSAGLRHKYIISSFLLNNTKFKLLKSKLVSSKGININGNKVARWKGGSSKKHAFIKIDFVRTFLSNKALVLNIVKSYKHSCLLALIKYSNGSYSYVLKPEGLEPGFWVKSLFKPINFGIPYKLGYLVLLKYLNPHSVIFNIEIHILKGGLICKSAGTFSEILVIDYFSNLVLLKLPTNKKIWVNSYCTAVLGRASNMYNHTSVIGKAGLNRNLNLRPRVRGVAMNPVDHPHGGRSKTNSPELTPWGKVAKKNR